MNKLPKRTTITLSVLTLPIIIALLVVVGLGVVTKNAVENKFANNAVLSDEDENKDESNDDDEDKNEDEDKNDEKDRRDESQDDRDEQEEKTKDQEQNNDSDDDEEEIEESDDIEDSEDEFDDGEETAEVSTVTNEDGTVTKIYKKTDGDEIKTKIITYDASGKIISEKELKENGSEDKSETKIISSVINPDGTITKTFTKTEGTKIEMKSLTYDQNGKLIKKTKLNADGSIKEEELVSKNDDEDESDESEDDDFELTFISKAGATVNSALSRVIKAKLKQEIENNDRLGSKVNKVELEIKTTQGTLKYEGTASKNEKLFGIFGIQIPVDIEIDSITGKITSVNQSFWAKIIDFLSL